MYCYSIPSFALSHSTSQFFTVTSQISAGPNWPGGKSGQTRAGRYPLTCAKNMVNMAPYDAV